MVRLALPVAVALLLVPAALAKEDEAAIVIGPYGTALVEPYALVGPVLRRVEPGATPTGPYALVYVQHRMLPSAPGRWYPRAAVYCDARSRCTRATQLRGSFGSGRITGLFRAEPTRLAALQRGDGRRLAAGGVLGLAIELAFGQAGASSRAVPPVGCTELRAAWRGWQAERRPTALCVGPNGGVYAGGRLYPLYSGIAARLSR